MIPVIPPPIGNPVPSLRGSLAPSLRRRRLPSTVRSRIHSLLRLAWLVVGFTGFGLVPTAGGAQGTPDVWVSLFDGVSLDGWVVENSDGANFSVHDGSLRVEEPSGWLRAEGSWTDFILELEFRFLTEGADSGVFFRAAARDGFVRGWPGQSYQVQLRDMHAPSNFLPLGQLYRHGMPDGPVTFEADAVNRLYRGVGEWHRLEVEVRGDLLLVRLEGTEVTRASQILNERAFLGLQGEIGTVEYREIRIRSLD